MVATGVAEPPTQAAGTCVDIKEFLWRKSADLTALPVTMFVFAVVYTAIITLGVVGNCLVIASVYRHRSLQSVRNIFIVSLSCSDIVVSIVSGTITPITAFAKVWLFGAALCKLVPLIQGTSLCFSTLTLTAISIDRFILIIYPTRRSIQQRHAFRMIALNCLVATAISTPMFFKQVLIDFNDFCGRFCAEDWGTDQRGRSTYGTLVFVLQFVIPFLVITFCYLMISLKLSKGMMLRKAAERHAVCARKRKSDESGSSVPAALVLDGSAAATAPDFSSSPLGRPRHGTSADDSADSAPLVASTAAGAVSAVSLPRDSVATNGATAPALVSSEQRRAALKRRLRTNRMLMAMVGVFLCCWTPSVVFNFLRDYQWLPEVVHRQEYLCGVVTHCISMSSTVWNPILYALLNEHFRLAFKELLRRAAGRARKRRDLFLEITGMASSSNGTPAGSAGRAANRSFVSRLLRYPRQVVAMLAGSGHQLAAVPCAADGSLNKTTPLICTVAATTTTSTSIAGGVDSGDSAPSGGDERPAAGVGPSADSAAATIVRRAAAPIYYNPADYVGYRESDEEV